MRSRSSAPSAVMKPAPKRSAIAAIAAPPVAVVPREIASASTTAAPSWASISRTVLLPLPMPPVRPTRQVISKPDGRKDGSRPEDHGREAGHREEGPEGNVAALAQAGGELHRDA